MYQLIYDFLSEHLFAGAMGEASFIIGGVSFDGSEWLAHTFAIVAVALIFVFAVKFIVWLFKMVSGLFMNIGR